MAQTPRAVRLAVAFALLAVAGSCRAPSGRIVPAGLQYLSREQWGANAPVLAMKTHEIRRLTIHHTAVAQAPARSAAEKLRALQLFSQRDDSLADGRRKPAWGDVPYHFYVATDGTVAEAREWRYVGDTNTRYDPTGHLLVVVEGNFQNEQLTDAQRRALEILIPALARRFDIPAGAIGGHRDFASTSCPGRNLYAELPRFRALSTEAQ
jgi:N-acetyl-anhydromuramyl-L-alanine amidase AmpD